MPWRFLLPLQGEEETIPKPAEDQLKRHPQGAYNHAILLEDDVSFYQRHGRELENSWHRARRGPAPRLKLSVEPVGPPVEGGINKAPLRYRRGHPHLEKPPVGGDG